MHRVLLPLALFLFSACSVIVDVDPGRLGDSDGGTGNGDSGGPDGEALDTGGPDSGALDAGSPDGGRPDGAIVDSSTSDQSIADTSTPDVPEPCDGACNTPPPCFAGGMCVEGVCHYTPAEGESCDDGDHCTTSDRCSAGVCAGTARVCDTPPEGECLGTVARTYHPVGECTDGACSYAADDQTCAFLCTGAGVCVDGCSGVTCDPPPEPICVSATILQTASEGICREGVCAYATTRETCEVRCEDGSCRGCEPTPHPCPDGWSYEESSGVRACSSPVFDPPNGVAPYCATAAMGYLGFNWRRFRDPLYTCPGSSSRYNDGATSYCIWEIEYPMGAEVDCNVEDGQIRYSWGC